MGLLELANAIIVALNDCLGEYSPAIPARNNVNNMDNLLEALQGMGVSTTGTFALTSQLDQVTLDRPWCQELLTAYMEGKSQGMNYQLNEERRVIHGPPGPERNRELDQTTGPWYAGNTLRTRRRSESPINTERLANEYREREPVTGLSPGNRRNRYRDR